MLCCIWLHSWMYNTYKFYMIHQDKVLSSIQKWLWINYLKFLFRIQMTVIWISMKFKCRKSLTVHLRDEKRTNLFLTLSRKYAFNFENIPDKKNILYFEILLFALNTRIRELILPRIRFILSLSIKTWHYLFVGISEI